MDNKKRAPALFALSLSLSRILNACYDTHTSPTTSGVNYRPKADFPYFPRVAIPTTDQHCQSTITQRPINGRPTNRWLNKVADGRASNRCRCCARRLLTQENLSYFYMSSRAPPWLITSGETKYSSPKTAGGQSKTVNVLLDVDHDERVRTLSPHGVSDISRYHRTSQSLPHTPLSKSCQCPVLSQVLTAGPDNRVVTRRARSLGRVHSS